MSFYCFFEAAGETRAGNQSLPDRIGARNQLEVFRSTENVGWKLKQPRSITNAAFFFVTSNEDLEALVSMSDELEGLRIALVLPNREEATIRTGLKLLPRFYCFTDSPVEEMALVIDKMIRNVAKNHLPLV